MSLQTGSRLIHRALSAIALALVCSDVWAQSLPPRTVLTVHWGTEDFPTNPVEDAGIRDAVLSGSDAGIDYYAEYLESESFPEEEASLALRDYIHRKYQGRRIDVVIAATDVALQFVLRFRGELFPDAPIVYRGIVAADATLRNAGAGLTGVWVGGGLNETLELALKLHPLTERVFVVAHARNISLQDSMQTEFGAVAQGVAITFITEESLPRMIAAVKAVPPRSVILYVRYSRNVPGHVLIPSEAARLVAEASPVPVYGISNAYIGSGVVGGMVYLTRELGTRMGEMARQILDGMRPQDIPIEQATLVPAFDWRQLQRWDIDPSRLPAGSNIRFRTPTTWESYRWYVIGAMTVVALQTLLIGGLLAHRASRRRAEAAIRNNEAVLRTSYEQIRQLAGRLIGAQEAERARIARDLHDDLSQKAATLAMDIHQISLGATPGTLERVRLRASQIATDVHNLSRELHPAQLHVFGLVKATQYFCRDIAARNDIEISFSHDCVPTTIASDSALCLYRIVQEGLQNVVKHSSAQAAAVRLSGMPDSLHLEITDSGVGFDTAAIGTGMGLLSMRERVNFLGGQMTVSSMPESGTRIDVSVPITQATDEARIILGTTELHDPRPRQQDSHPPIAAAR